MKGFNTEALEAELAAREGERRTPVWYHDFNCTTVCWGEQREWETVDESGMPVKHSYTFIYKYTVPFFGLNWCKPPGYYADAVQEEEHPASSGTRTPGSTPKR